MQSEDMPPPYQESTTPASGSASSTGVDPHNLEMRQQDSLAVSSERAGDSVDSFQGILNDSLADIHTDGIIHLRPFQRIISRSSFTTVLPVFCTIILLFCFVKEAISELDTSLSALGSLGDTAYRYSVPSGIAMTPSGDAEENSIDKVTIEALNSAATDRDSFLVLSTTVLDVALNWRSLSCDAGHASQGAEWRRLFYALHDFANVAVINSRERQMLLATLDGVLDAKTEVFNGITLRAVTEASSPDSTALQLEIGEFRTRLTRAIAAAETFDATLAALDAALGRIRLHYRNEAKYLSGTTAAIFAGIRGSWGIDARKKGLLQQINDWDLPMLAHISSMRLAVFQIKAGLRELRQQVHHLDGTGIRDKKAPDWQTASGERVWGRIERSLSVLKG